MRPWNYCPNCAMPLMRLSEVADSFDEASGVPLVKTATRPARPHRANKTVPKWFSNPAMTAADVLAFGKAADAKTVRRHGPKPGYKMTPKHRAALKKAWAARSRQAAAARKAKGA